MSEIILTSQDNLREIMAQVVEEKLIVLKQWFESLSLQNERPLNRQEAKDYLGVSPSTLNRYVNKGLIPRYGLDGKVYYRRNELDEAMVLTNNFKNLKLVS